MAQEPSYPDPDPSTEAMHPYTNHYPMPPPGHSHISHPVEATMRRDSNGSSSFLQGSGHIGAHAQPATPQQLAQRSLDVNHDSDQNPDSSSRKRSKVSRACDECRRKKIRCDADSETPGATCSSCRRSGTSCDFSRAPQKRGPSKGYIKELAERVNNLEYRTGAAPPTPSDFQYNSLAPGQGADYLTSSEPVMRKRGFDSFAEPYYDNAYNSLEDFTSRHERPHSNNSVREDPSTENLQLTINAQPPPINMNATVVHADLVNAYYKLIHPFLPLLPHTTATLQNNVQKVSAGVCEAFFGALDAAVTALSRADAHGALKSATGQLKIVLGDSGYTDTMLGKLVYLEALILIVIATDNAGPSYKSEGPWISLAVETAQKMKLDIPSRPNDPKEPDPYTRGDLGRRAWLILFILDRWHALSKSDMLRVSEVNCDLVDFDRELMGENPYQFFRISRIVGHLYEAFITCSEEVADPAFKGGIISKSLNREIVSFRESVYQNFAKMPHVHMAYLHVRSIADGSLASYRSKTGAIVNNVFQIVTLLNSTKGVYCAPWMHHIVGFTAITLGRIADYQVHAGATAASRDLRDGLNTSLFRLNKDKTAWDMAISASITKRLDAGSEVTEAADAGDRNGLGQLADAAIGKGGATNGAGDGNTSNAAELSPDDFEMITQGYLNTYE